MASTLAPPKPQTAGAGPPPGPPGGGFGDDPQPPPQPDEAAVALRRYRTGMWLAIGGITMVFAGFTSAYVVRKGLGADWRSISLPPLLGFNTAVLLASSVTLEAARRRSLEPAAGAWLAATAALGALFLGGQYLAWRELAARGVYLATNPSSSFFYLLTGAHALHLLGGVAALFTVALRVRLQRVWRRRRAAIEATALYWHSMDALWIYVLLLLLVGR